MAPRHTLASLPLSSLWLAQARSQQHYYTLAPPSWQNGPLQPLPVGASCSNLCWETKPEKESPICIFSLIPDTAPVCSTYRLTVGSYTTRSKLNNKGVTRAVKMILELNNIFPFHLLFMKAFRELSVQCILLLLQNSLSLTHTKKGKKKSIRLDICLYCVNKRLFSIGKSIAWIILTDL